MRTRKLTHYDDSAGMNQIGTQLTTIQRCVMKVNNEEVQPGDFWVSTSRGMSGWFAVLMWL
ncbi:MAG: hypothetical protein ACHQWH_04210, partial [Nitrososphaerales archaeon]